MSGEAVEQGRKRRWPWIVGALLGLPLLLIAGLLLVMEYNSRQSFPEATPDAQQAALVSRAEQLGATDLRTLAAPGGGIVLAGKLEGRQFSVAIPRTWNGGALLFLHGYSTPGTPVRVLDDPIAWGSGSNDVLLKAYRDGYAAGHTAYDKAGLGVESASRNTKRLRDLLAGLGARRVLLAGTSMGGNIVLSLLENYPGDFQGAMASCGVTDGWETQLGQLIDMRAAYNALTAGTPYELPGEKDVRRSALSAEAPLGLESAKELYRWMQIYRVAMPVIALSKAAAANPQGPEARILRQVASIGGFEPEVASLAFPLVTVSLGMDDMVATLGGQIHGNRHTLYASPELSAAEAAKLNRDIQRLDADPQAIANARRWHQANGSFDVPLVTIHNRIDSLVPHSQTEALGRIAAAAGKSAKLLQFTVPPTRAKLPIGGVEGYTHCGFDKTQSAAVWEALRGWVETGVRPPAVLPG